MEHAKSDAAGTDDQSVDSGYEAEPRLGLARRDDVCRPVTAAQLEPTRQVVGVPVRLDHEFQRRMRCVEELLDPVDVPGRVDDGGLTVVHHEIAAVAETC